MIHMQFYIFVQSLCSKMNVVMFGTQINIVPTGTLAVNSSESTACFWDGVMRFSQGLFSIYLAATVGHFLLGNEFLFCIEGYGLWFVMGVIVFTCEVH